MGKLLTKNEAAEILGVSRQTIENWIWQGVFRDKYINGSYYIDSDMITGIFDTVKDISETKEKLSQIKKDLINEHEKWDKMVEEAKRNLRCASKIKNSLVRKEFYHAVIDFVCNNSMLNLHTSYIMHMLLEGGNFQDISCCISLSEERIRQIVYDFIRDTGRYIIDNDTISDNNKLRKRIQQLEGENEQLKTKLLQLNLEVDQDAFKLTDEEERLYKIMFLNIAESPLSVRTKRILLNKKINMMHDLVSKTEKYLCELDGFGPKCLSDVTDYIESYGLYLGFDVEQIFEKHQRAVRHSNLSEKLIFEKE